jgi:hypothetical protein
MGALNERERFIVRERKLREEIPRTLESLGNELGLSKERVRQLEAAAFGKMRKTLAIAAVDALGGPVVVITGNGHAETARGIPALLDRARPDLSVLSVGQLEADPGPEAPFDLWILTDPVDRPDPCAAFHGQQDSGR